MGLQEGFNELSNFFFSFFAGTASGSFEYVFTYVRLTVFLGHSTQSEQVDNDIRALVSGRVPADFGEYNIQCQHAIA